MKKFLMTILILGLSASAGSANSNVQGEKLGVYAGATKHIITSKFKKDNHNGLLNKLRRDGDIYLGFKVYENLAIEGGYESTLVRRLESSLTPEQCPNLFVIMRHHPGAKVPMCITNLKIKGPYLGLVLSHKLGNYPVSLLGSVGISLIKASASCGPSPRLNYLAIGGVEFSHSRTTEAFRFMGGVQYLMASGIGFRSTISTISSKKIVFRNFNGTYIEVPRIKMKDSATVGVGMFFEF